MTANSDELRKLAFTDRVDELFEFTDPAPNVPGMHAERSRVNLSSATLTDRVDELVVFEDGAGLKVPEPGALIVPALPIPPDQQPQSGGHAE